MRALRFRVRTLMAAVAVVALGIWGGKMGLRSYLYYRMSHEYRLQERGWLNIAARKPARRRWYIRCAEYYAQLDRNARRAMWHPWEPVAPNPPAPVFRPGIDG